MQVISIIITLLLGSQIALAQAKDNLQPLRLSFGVSGGIGVRLFSPVPNVENTISTILLYQGKPKRSGWCGCEYFTMDEKGDIVEVKYDEYNADINARLGLFRNNDNGWLFNFAYMFSRYSYSFKNPPFQFKSYTLTDRNSDLESHGIMFGVAKIWQSVFVRIGGLYYYKHTTGGFNKPIDKNYRLNYIENNTGFLVDIGGRGDNNFAIIPEIGLTSKKYPMELSVSAVLPISDYAFTERYRYYRNRYLVGEANASYSTMNIALNLRLIGFTLFNINKRNRSKSTDLALRRQISSPTPSVDTAPVHRTPVEAPPKPSLNNTRFDRLTKKESTRLAVFFDLEKADLKSASFPELNDLAQWLTLNPTVEIRLEGHTDLIGDAPENMRLSVRRVDVVRDYLVNKGVTSSRIETKGYGETRPINRDCPPPNYCPENRRVEMVITKR